jgi:hypothetical protein
MKNENARYDRADGQQAASQQDQNQGSRDFFLGWRPFSRFDFNVLVVLATSVSGSGHARRFPSFGLEIESPDHFDQTDAKQPGHDNKRLSWQRGHATEDGYDHPKQHRPKADQQISVGFLMEGSSRCARILIDTIVD